MSSHILSAPIIPVNIGSIYRPDGKVFKPVFIVYYIGKVSVVGLTSLYAVDTITCEIANALYAPIQGSEQLRTSAVGERGG